MSGDTLSDDGKWFWDGSGWSAKHAVVSGSVIPRALAWTLLGGLPLGAIAALVVGPLSARINGTLGFTSVALVMLGAGILVISIVVRRTPRIEIERGRIRIGSLGRSKISSELAVSQVNSVELVRSNTTFMATEGALGEGRVLMHVAGQAPIELGWDAFGNRASRLAWLLNVPLIEGDVKTTPGGPIAVSPANPVYVQMSPRSVVIVVVIVAVAAVLLFAPLVTSLVKSH